MTPRPRWAGRHRHFQRVTLFVGVTLLALVVWSVTRPMAPSPPTVAGSWVGVGSAYDSTAGGTDRIAILLSLRQSPEGQLVGSARECNDHGQNATFAVTGQAVYSTVTLTFSGVTLHGRLAHAGFNVAGAANGTSIQLDLRRGDQSAFTADCSAINTEPTSST